MADGPPDDRDPEPPTVGATAGDDGSATIGLLVGSDENRRLLRTWLGERHDVVEPDLDVSSLPPGVDTWLVDGRAAERGDDRLRAAQAEAAPAFLPLAYLARPGEDERPADRPWSTFDDVVSMPVPRAELRGRLEALLRARRLSLELAEQRDRLDAFAGFLAHDLRNPLSAARGWLSLVESGDDSDELDGVERSLRRMDALITDVLAIAREGDVSLDPEPADLGARSEAAWSSFEGGDATLEVESRPLRADPGALERLLENLFRNSLEHGTGDGGTVAVRVGPLSDGFYVEDDGPGVPAAEGGGARFEVRGVEPA